MTKTLCALALGAILAGCSSSTTINNGVEPEKPMVDPCKGNFRSNGVDWTYYPRLPGIEMNAVGSDQPGGWCCELADGSPDLCSCADPHDDAGVCQSPNPVVFNP